MTSLATIMIKVRSENYSSDTEGSTSDVVEPLQTSISGWLPPGDYDPWGPHGGGPPAYFEFDICWEPADQQCGVFAWDGTGEPPGPFGEYYSGGEAADTIPVPYLATWWLVIIARENNTETIHYWGVYVFHAL